MAVFTKLTMILPDKKEVLVPINLDAIVRVGFAHPDNPDGASFICFVDGHIADFKESVAKIWKEHLSSRGL